MNGAVAAVILPDLRARIIDFVRLASTEVSTHDEQVLPELTATLPRGCTVYVAQTPEAPFEDVIRIALLVQSLGLQASPHLVARRIPSGQALREGLKRLTGAGVERALLVAGDRHSPLGPYTNTLDVIAADVLTGCGLRRLGVAGHPEGHPHASPDEVWHSLHLKQEYGVRTGIALHVVTQFGFDPQGIHLWAAQFNGHGIELPVHAGVAGPTSLTKLLRFAMQCGVGASLPSFATSAKAVSSVTRHAMTPEELLPTLVALGAGGDSAQIVQPHFFTFGGALATAKWLRAVTEGAFTMLSEGKITL